MKTGYFGGALIDEEGFVINAKNGVPISVYTVSGHPTFACPELKCGIKLDYAVAMTFLNNGNCIIEKDRYYIEHLDGDPMNCRLDNLRLITDKEEVKEKRYGYLKGKRKGKKTIDFSKMLYVADRSTLSIKEYTVSEFCKEFNISRVAALRKAENEAFVLPDSSRYVVCETYLDAWERL